MRNLENYNCKFNIDFVDLDIFVKNLKNHFKFVSDERSEIDF